GAMHSNGIVLCFIFAAAACAQDFRASVAGYVTDGTGAAIADAKVRAVQRDTNQATEAVTNREGFYALSYLAPSVYDLEVTAKGFKKLKRENVTLLVAQKLDLDLKLELGAVTSEITVSGELESIQSG